VYVLGNDISQNAVKRGLNSVVSSSALNMLGRSAEALATALAGNVQQGEEQWEESSLASNDGEGTDGAVSTPSYSPQYPDWRGLSYSEEHSALYSSSSSDGGSSSSSCEREEWGTSLEQLRSSTRISGEIAAMFARAIAQDGGNTLNACRARVRASLQLDEEQQQLLTESTLKKIATMQQRCRFYSLVQPVQ
jgi:hypothetical protein